MGQWLLFTSTLWHGRSCSSSGCFLLFYSLFFVSFKKKTYSDEVIQINQLIYEELRVRKYIEDKDLTEEARELKELYKRVWD